MRSYETARSLFSFLALCAWTVVAIGVLVALIGAAAGSQYGGAATGFLALALGAGVVVTGLILVAFVQMGRASVDTAEYTQQMLKVARYQLEISKQSQRGSNHSPQKLPTTQKTEGGSSSASISQRVSPAPLKVKQKIEMVNDPDVEKGHKDGWIEYKGQRVEVQNATYYLSGSIFTSLDQVQKAIDKKGKLFKI